MQRLVIAAVFLSGFSTQHVFASGAIYCGDQNGKSACVAAVRFPQYAEAATQAAGLCSRSGLLNCKPYESPPLLTCRSISAPGGNWPSMYFDAPYAQKAAFLAQDDCGWRTPSGPKCVTVFTVCEASENSADIKYSPALIGPEQNEVQFVSPAFAQPTPPPAPHPQIIQQIVYSSNSFAAAAIGFAVAILFAIGLVFRHSMSNFVIHGNLPYKLPVYGEDIQCLFKRTQRVNWYGRVVFGIVVNLTMTHQQLIDVRKYWLGRVIAFDSLRRQRQNELARMHLQLAASVKSDPHDKKKFWSRRWATIRTFIRRLLWIFTAFFSFLLGFFFIRVTLAKLIRGTVVESKDLVLILQAKEAIEESTTYLKEYLTTANTFDGGDEIYEPQ